MDLREAACAVRQQAETAAAKGKTEGKPMPEAESGGVKELAAA